MRCIASSGMQGPGPYAGVRALRPSNQRATDPTPTVEPNGRARFVGPVIGVHVRNGDYCSFENDNGGLCLMYRHCICDGFVPYLDRIRAMRDRYDISTVFIATQVTLHTETRTPTCPNPLKPKTLKKNQKTQNPELRDPSFEASRHADGLHACCIPVAPCAHRMRAFSRRRVRRRQRKVCAS